MALSSSELIDFLEEVDKRLERKVTLVAAGGTAMTLHKLKPSTLDVDFTGPGDDIESFNRAVRRVQPGFEVHTWPDGQVFMQVLPPDYLKKSTPIRTKLENIELRALHPVDIVVTKVGRLDERDIEDIRACIKARGLRRRTVLARAKKVHYAGNQALYDHNLETVKRELFPRLKKEA